MTVDQEIHAQETSLNGNEAGAVPDKDAIRAEWLTMREAFHQLLADIPEEAWRRQSKSTRWNIAELCAHMVHDVELVPTYVDKVRQGKDMLNLPPRITNVMNWLLTKVLGRRATPASLARKFDEGYEESLKVLDGIQDDEWQRGANFFGEGYWTIEFIFHQSPQHFEEHAAQIRESF